MAENEEETNTSNEENSDSEDTEENQNSENEDAEEEEEEESSPDDNWTPHKGLIMQIKPYKYFQDISWDKSYEDPTGTGNVTLPYSKDSDEYAFTPDDVKYIYKGVSVKVKVRRSCDEQFKPTGIEETGLDEYSIREREHIPTEEQKTELGLITEETGTEEQDSETETEEPVEDIKYSRSSYDDGIYGFISDVSYSEDGAELEIKDWGKALEKDDIKLEFNELHSIIFEEVIKSYGLIPDVDFTGLPNKTLSWSNITQSNEETTSGDSGASGEASTGNDCTPTNTMSCKHGASHGNAGNGENFDDCYKKGYAKEGTNYYKWARGYSDGKKMLSDLRKRWEYCKPRYSGNKKCPEKVFEDGSGNCYDSCRLVKCCCDAIGFPCVVITGSIYQGGHGWNAVKVDGKWETFDLCYGYTSRCDSGGTNTSNIW